ncbi:alpha-glucosidase [Metarhizium album ARSEF 1941]|uniref:Probable alpha/beta-glucosidase agdC n=1 Tax=Metarhizium album (strain ARSEF 1941) TaxID=1081103 RepID=A0A0B2WLB4_METAS|nr:alpha-glucosidase [Metarhizium album ARSEF 1941]KHN93800.1 alpha-glucosidase [Metarhizium album ARSEF 1941]
MRPGRALRFVALALGGMSLSSAASFYNNTRDRLLDCPGYRTVKETKVGGGGYLELELDGEPCNVYGKDIRRLQVNWTVESRDRIHVVIFDADQEAYQVPESVFPRPGRSSSLGPKLEFDYTPSPFTFKIFRRRDESVLFDSSAAGMVFEDQYIRLRTALPFNPNLYGLGEHSDSFRLKNTNYTRTLWNADSPSVPKGWNLYGSHPMYFEQRSRYTHGVFMLNSNGMDIVVDRDEWSGFLEYNMVGGVIDLWFFAGESPVDVAKQYSLVTQPPAMVPYSALGFHQCRFGYQDVFNVAEVVHNYSKAGIPLETMWTDIDYMDGRTVFTVDPQRFPLSKMRQLVDHLHANNQKFVLMIDPGIASKDYGPYKRGLDYPPSFLLNASMLPYEAVVWPGRTVFPDWFAYGVQQYWNKEFELFFNPLTGIDIDFLWIDMNEPSNFCDWPCTNIDEVAALYPPPPPPVRTPPRELPGWPCGLQPPGKNCTLKIEQRPRLKARTWDAWRHWKWKMRRSHYPQPNNFEQPLLPDIGPSTRTTPQWKDKFLGFRNRSLTDPPYTINNAWGPLPQKTIDTRLMHLNGLRLYDTHNLYGTMMAAASRRAMIARRPDRRPLVVTRSTFAGSGAHSAHWLGDNDSSWEHYRLSIRQMLQFNSMFQVSMVGSDVCGFNGDTNEELCARWAMLGAFQPFYRNHNSEGQVDQEFYRWPVVTAAAKKAIDIRYRLLDYFYTAMMQQSLDGTPSINPMFYFYSNDANTWGLDLQYFYGPALLVAPVTTKGETSVNIYFPNDIFYDFYTYEQYYGTGQWTIKRNQSTTDIPLYIRGGQIIPMRASSAMTTAKLREQDFEILVAVNFQGRATGTLYLDDGESLLGERSTIKFSYKKGKLHLRADMKYKTNAKIVKVTVLGSYKCGPGESSCSMELNHPVGKKLVLDI